MMMSADPAVTDSQLLLQIHVRGLSCFGTCICYRFILVAGQVVGAPAAAATETHTRVAPCSINASDKEQGTGAVPHC